jgi:hypothetical protein
VPLLADDVARQWLGLLSDHRTGDNGDELLADTRCERLVAAVLGTAATSALVAARAPDE